MGSLYRSQHELVFVFKNGRNGHRNNVQLGRLGRNRTNVWHYRGANSFARCGAEGNLLALHPTVKPVAMIPIPAFDTMSAVPGPIPELCVLPTSPAGLHHPQGQRKARYWLPACSGWIAARAGIYVVSAIITQRTIPAPAASIAARAGPMRSRNGPPINKKTTTSAATEIDHSTPTVPGPTPAASQRITAKCRASHGCRGSRLRQGQSGVDTVTAPPSFRRRRSAGAMRNYRADPSFDPGLASEDRPQKRTVMPPSETAAANLIIFISPRALIPKEADIELESCTRFSTA